MSPQFVGADALLGQDGELGIGMNDRVESVHIFCRVIQELATCLESQTDHLRHLIVGHSVGFGTTADLWSLGTCGSMKPSQHFKVLKWLPLSVGQR